MLLRYQVLLINSSQNKFISGLLAASFTTSSDKHRRLFDQQSIFKRADDKKTNVNMRSNI